MRAEISIDGSHLHLIQDRERIVVPTKDVDAFLPELKEIVQQARNKKIGQLQEQIEILQKELEEVQPAPEPPKEYLRPYGAPCEGGRDNCPTLGFLKSRQTGLCCVCRRLRGDYEENETE